MIVGYARVSADGQTLDAQQAALREAGCAAKVYSEKISGAVADRPALAKAIGALADGDTLVVCKLDRLARSTRDLLNTLDAIGRLAQPSNHLPMVGLTQPLRMAD
jgi:DNA invertase Pin-like site-specific DNA recombinase